MYTSTYSTSEIARVEIVADILLPCSFYPWTSNVTIACALARLGGFGDRFVTSCNGADGI